MIRINLLPIREISAEVTRRRDLIVGATTLVVTLVVIAGVYFSQASHLSSLQKQLAELRKENEMLNTQVKEVGELQNKIKELKSKTQVLEDLNRKKVGPVRVLESLAAATPSGLWITEYRESGNDVSITGMAMDNQTVADFLRALSTFAYFRGVELVETTQADEKTGAYKRFAIRSGVTYQPPVSVDAKSESRPATKEDPKK
jgi:type IV pilus assembly protein PilN